MTPHVCPKCDGEKLRMERCAPCGGTGIVWRGDDAAAAGVPTTPSLPNLPPYGNIFPVTLDGANATMVFTDASGYTIELIQPDLMH